MNGYCFLLRDYLYPDCKTRSDVYVYSRSIPPCHKYMPITFPDWIADIFRYRTNTHTVVTSITGVYIETNLRVA